MKKKILGILAVISSVAVLVGMMVSPVVGANLSLKANNVSMTSDDGQIKSATISPEGIFSWKGVDVDVQFDGDDRINYNIYIKLNDGDWGLLYSANNYKNIEDMGTTGHDKFVFKDIELSKPNVIAYWQLEANEDGVENTNQIGVKIKATLQTSDVVNGVTEWKNLVSTSSTTSFSFTCTNEKAVASIGGYIRPDGVSTPDT